MQRFRVWRTALMAVATLSMAGASLAGTLVSTPGPELWLSPPGAEVGKTVDAGEDFELTLHLQGEPDTTYEVHVAYDGDDVGTCVEDTVTLTTNPQGKAVWTCELTTPSHDGEEDLDGTVTFSVWFDGGEVASIDALLSVHAAEEDGDEPADPDEADGANHGQCVSYWAHAAKDEGLSGRWFGAFISGVAASDGTATKGEEPADGCDFAEELEQALADQEEAEAAKAEAKAAKAELRAEKAAEREARRADKAGKHDEEGEE